MASIDLLDKAVAEYIETIGELPACIWLCTLCSKLLDKELRSWSAANRYRRGIAVDTRLNGVVRCLLCSTGIYVERNSHGVTS